MELPSKERWLNKAEIVDAFRLVPRLLLIGVSMLVWTVITWYMGIPLPTTQHTILVSAVIGIIPIIIGLYQSSGRPWK